MEIPQPNPTKQEQQFLWFFGGIVLFGGLLAVGYIFATDPDTTGIPMISPDSQALAQNDAGARLARLEMGLADANARIASANSRIEHLEARLLSPTAASSSQGGQGTYWSDDCNIPTGVLVNGVCQHAKVIAPNGGENLCMGKTQTISWKVPKEMDAVNIMLTQLNGTSFNIGTYPATLNETGQKNTGEGSFPWKVGEYLGGTVREGMTYVISLSGTYPVNQGMNAMLVDQSDHIFSVIDCRG